MSSREFHYDLEQGTQEWLDVRKNRLTASHATAIAANGKGLETYLKKKVLDIIGAAAKRFYGSDMERGDELEPIARMKYEFERKVDVVECGFITYGEFAGASPDGLVMEDPEGKGAIEIKARNNEKHLELLLGGKLESGVLNQMNMVMWIGDLTWCDFISYNENFKQSIFIKRVYRDEAYIKKLEVGTMVGGAKLKALLEKAVIKKEMEVAES